MAPRLVLASASPARLRLLRMAGFDPEVQVSGVAEDDVDGLSPGDTALVLAERKATATAARLAGGDGGDGGGDAGGGGGGGGDVLVVGCDSVFEFEGVAYGKPPSPEEAVRRWHRMRGHAGRLHTGHCVVDGRTGAQVSAVAGTLVHFGDPSDAEIDAYVATGEPLAVAGAFTLDGRSAPFVTGIEGDAGNVIGLCLPVLRALLARLDVDITDLWSPC